jgi:Domain of unknown function (DUF4249)
MIPKREIFGFKYYLFLGLFLFLCCVRRIDPPIRSGTSLLVVEGLITTDSTPYTVKLSYTGNFTNASTAVDSNQNFVNDAKVFIKDNAGDSSVCNLISPGTYQSNDSSFVGIVGWTYTLEIYLSNGKVYRSSPETIIEVPPIDSLSLFFDSTYITDVRPNQFIISTHLRDPANTANYYRWTSSGYFSRKSWGGTCGFNWGPCGDPFSCNCHAQCKQSFQSDQIVVQSDQFVNGQEIIEPVCYVPIYWFGDDFIEISQYSLSETAYGFWSQYLDQTNRTGSVLDPLPASLLGNVVNIADSTDIALGLFAASDVKKRKLKIVPYNFQEYWLESIAVEFIQPGDCQVVYPGALPDDTDPSGWDNAQEIDLH